MRKRGLILCIVALPILVAFYATLLYWSSPHTGGTQLRIDQYITLLRQGRIQTATILESDNRITGKYDAINIKLDKAGGLTEALELAAAARARGFKIMVGCMIGTSLAMAPAVLVAQQAAVVDLDAPLLLAQDRVPGLRYDGSTLYPPEPALWG